MTKKYILELDEMQASVLQRLLRMEQYDQRKWDEEEKGVHKEIREHIIEEMQKLRDELNKQGEPYYECYAYYERW